ncbi:sporulation integral membrane protein YtvI [Parageobacillus thermoglucosidasius]|uniref:sporulation integral membrane protein YtvI n=1 Tax=Parageobacillus thermoglucosidasius TaxID=1426 RepID=UPI000F61D28F|nr:sporulation integral membrane protein YtvI [Parageobacillus thermoglucosidasius]GCD81555.1 sporulation integral membrane protein YtvI [Parageobacillus thermoglucosidasius]
MSRHHLYSFLRFLLVIAIVVLGAIALYYVSTVIYPFIIAFFIAFFINPLVDFLETKAKMPRWLAVVVTLIVLFALVAGLVTLLIAEIVSGTQYLANVVPENFQKLVKYMETFFAQQIIPLYHDLAVLFKNLDASQQDTIMNNIQAVGTQIATTVGQFTQRVLQNIPQLLTWLPNAATVFIFSLLATFFISKDWYRLTGMVQKILPAKAHKSGKTVFLDLKKALFGFIKAQATLISITTVIVLIGLLILGVDYAITIALIIGLVDILPYLGTGIVFVPWIIYAAISGNVPFAIGLGVLYIIVLVQRQIMEPKVLSSSIGLDPLATLVALFVGFKLIGFLGLIVGPVTLVIIRTLHSANVFRDIWNFIIGKPAS